VAESDSTAPEQPSVSSGSRAGRKAEPFSLGLVCFTDPRETGLAEKRESYLRACHQSLAQALRDNGLIVADPLEQMRSPRDPFFGLRSMEETRRAARSLRSHDLAGVIIGCWHWTEPALPIALVRDLNVPVALYSADDPAWAGSVHLTALGASLWQWAGSNYAVRHFRSMGDIASLLDWASGAVALAKLRSGSLLLWGGSYCLRMEHLQEDLSSLKACVVGDVLIEDEYILIRRAEEILASKPERVERFRSWLIQGGTKIVFDSTMLTEESLSSQIALYLAARDRLEELSGESILGVSVRCQPTLSEEWGKTACFLPAFLPFCEDAEGPRDVVPTVCEGDVKGLVTAALLSLASRGAPPLFGDLKYIGHDGMIISNCGASSVFYAANSLAAERVLPRLTISGQCQGRSGGAIGYEGQPGAMTIARLIRIRDRLLMHLGLAESLTIDERILAKIMWGRMWPHAALRLPVDRQLLVAALGSNHYCAVPGDHVRELELACGIAGTPVLRIDDEQQLRGFTAQ